MIDFDANATTSLDPRVLEAMKPHLLMGGNPESRHRNGRTARKAWDDSKETIAGILGAHPDELVLTSGGTESNNTALFSLVALLSRNKKEGELVNVLLSEIEHPAVTEPLIFLEKRNLVRREIGKVLSDGSADTVHWKQRILSESHPDLISLMLANNETGTLQNVQELAAAAKSMNILFHTDAVQAVGRMDVNFSELGVSTLAASSHKMHGPPGIGILLIRRGIRLDPLLHGGGQQNGMRPGTPTVALIVGLAESLRLWESERITRSRCWSEFRTILLSGLRTRLADTRVNIVVNGAENPESRLPQTLNLWFDHPSIDSDLLLMRLDLAGLAVSLGSACSSGSMKPSPVLIAMGHGQIRARSSLRISFSALSTIDEVSRSVLILESVIRDLIDENTVDPDEARNRMK